MTQQTSQKTPRFYFILLLPVFFVLHAYTEHFGFVPVKDALLLALGYSAMALAILLFSYFFFRSWPRAALITALWMGVFFFFGALHEFMKKYSPVPWLARYSFLLPACLVILVSLFIFLKKTSIRFRRFSIFLNTLLVVYIIIDLFTIAFLSTQNNQIELGGKGLLNLENGTVCDTCQKPDIYFLLFDEYASTVSLRDTYHHDNSDIDSFLLSNGFSIQRHSRSNYNLTVMSMASLLNMSYLGVIEDPKSLTVKDYGNSNLLLLNNNTTTFLSAQGYEFVNYSIFDFVRHPTLVKQSFLPLQTRLITERTLFARLNKDIGWILAIKLGLGGSDDFFTRHLKNDDLFLKLTKEETTKKRKKPRFVYAHLNIPHRPYYYDKNLKRKDYETVVREYKSNPTQAYIDYLNYTNTQMRELVNTIQSNNPRAVIIILGDHGFRTNIPGKDLSHFFPNFNAVYFPDRDYKNLYDSITSVNQFRVIFNKLFNQSFKTLKDTSILLQDNVY